MLLDPLKLHVLVEQEVAVLGFHPAEAVLVLGILHSFVTVQVQGVLQLLLPILVLKITNKVG